MHGTMNIKKTVINTRVPEKAAIFLEELKNCLMEGITVRYE